ncbi:hypothetical protein [Coraliomargarita parva]|uniref:hypothetical protein n=1 Tax=Coraliomargarita parva TaxID=3014050 RepID=UPI0022B2D081|nr:hypothetical protein [Coraliomargarita parva]
MSFIANKFPGVAPALVVDGCGNSVYAGVLGHHGEWKSQSISTGAPLEQLFPAVENALQEAELSVDGLGSFIYCQGPGSVLGLRLCAMAIETWRRLGVASRPCFAYNSLTLTAELLKKDRAPDEALLFADWKKGAWHAVEFKAGMADACHVMDDATLQAYGGQRFHLPQRKGWQAAPDGAVPLAYEPQRLHEVLFVDGLLRRTEGVELVTSSAAQFTKWVPERHRASS